MQSEAAVIGSLLDLCWSSSQDFRRTFGRVLGQQELIFRVWACLQVTAKMAEVLPSCNAVEMYSAALAACTGEGRVVLLLCTCSQLAILCAAPLARWSVIPCKMLVFAAAGFPCQYTGLSF